LCPLPLVLSLGTTGKNYRKGTVVGNDGQALSKTGSETGPVTS